MQLIDSHCHLDFAAFNSDRQQVLQRANENNIRHIVIPGTEKVHWHRIKALSSRYQNLHACYGLHPYWLKQHKQQDLTHLEKYIGNNQPVAVGECGLDFRPQQADKKTQLFFFEAQLAMAENLQLPVVIHAVKATEAVIQSIKKFKNLTGMVHSYSGSLEQAKQLMALNFFISISGSITYEHAKKIKTVVNKLPLTSLLLETDAPDQADKKNAGHRNEPAFLLNTARAMAEIREESLAKIAEQTSLNAKKLFRL